MHVNAKIISQGFRSCVSSVRKDPVKKKVAVVCSLNSEVTKAVAFPWILPNASHDAWSVQCRVKKDSSGKHSQWSTVKLCLHRDAQSHFVKKCTPSLVAPAVAWSINHMLLLHCLQHSCCMSMNSCICGVFKWCIVNCKRSCRERKA